MAYLLGVYVAGLCLCLIGFLLARSYEQRAARLALMILAYAFWPLTVVAVIVAALWRKFRGQAILHSTTILQSLARAARDPYREL